MEKTPIFADSCVVEKWHSDSTAFTYDFRIREDGSVESAPIPRKVLESDSGKPYGYLYPSDFGRNVYDTVSDTVRRVAGFLNGEFGYFGPVRCDAFASGSTKFHCGKCERTRISGAV